jgi:hypothetical protein
MARERKQIMATKKAEHDLTTVHGFLAAVDAKVTALIRKHGWCSSAHYYVSEWSGTTERNGRQAYVIPERDNRRNLEETTLSHVPDEYLSDAGREKKAGEGAEVLAQLRAGAVQALKTAVSQGYLDDEKEIASIASELGLDLPARVQAHKGTVHLPGMVIHTAAQLTETERATLRDELGAAVSGVLAQHPELGSVTVPAATIESNSRASYTWA